MKRNVFPVIMMVFVSVLLSLLFAACSSGGSDSSGGGGGGGGNVVGGPSISSVSNLTNPNQPLRVGDWTQIDGFSFTDRAVTPPSGSYAAFTDGTTTVQATLYSIYTMGQIVCRVPDGIPTSCSVIVKTSSGGTTNPYPITVNPVPNPSPQPTPPVPTPSPSPTAPSDIVTMENQVKTLVDNERIANGKPALEWNESLRTVARKHSQDMIDRNFFSHINPDGLDPFQRMTAAGISFTAAAENIAQNQGFADPGSQAVIGWMNSQGHRDNILDVNNYGFSQTGVGIAKKADGTYFFTQLFIKP
jgi:uncharacterized protein YkwD